MNQSEKKSLRRDLWTELPRKWKMMTFKIQNFTSKERRKASQRSQEEREKWRIVVRRSSQKKVKVSQWRKLARIRWSQAVLEVGCMFDLVKFYHKKGYKSHLLKILWPNSSILSAQSKSTRNLTKKVNTKEHLLFEIQEEKTNTVSRAFAQRSWRDMRGT